MNTNFKDIINDLKNIEQTFIDYFSVNAHVQQQPQIQEPLQHHHYHHTNVNSVTLVPPTTNIINNYMLSHSSYSPDTRSKKSETIFPKKEEKLTKTQIIAGTSSMGIIALVTTYFLSQDEYVKYIMSQIDTKVDKLKIKFIEITLDHTNTDGHVLITDFMDNYTEWKYLFVNRTKNALYTKILGSGSLIGSIGGIMINNRFCLFSGLVGSFSSGCCMLWRYMTGNTRSENEYFIKMNENLIKLITLYENKKQSHIHNIQPSAPLLHNGLCPDGQMPPAYGE